MQHADDASFKSSRLKRSGNSPPPLKGPFPHHYVPLTVRDDVRTCTCTALPPPHALIMQAAGALVVGKTNLDQFATGLVGSRTPYGPCVNAFHPDNVSGGSSGGSAVAVARNLVSFALGTDTAGSGRVPAGFNNLVGVKPSRSAISTTGVLPACRSLDCVSVFALTVQDWYTVLQVRGIDSKSSPVASQATWSQKTHCTAQCLGPSHVSRCGILWEP